MLKLSDLADKIAPHLIGVSTPFGGALAKNYIGADIDDSDDALPTGEDLEKVKADAQAGIDKANAGIDKANAGVDKANAGVDKANAGVDKANAGVDKANAELENVNQQITNLKNEMENVGSKVMSHIPDLSNGQDLDTSTIKDPRTAVTYTLQQKNGTSDPYIALDTPVTQSEPIILGVRPSPYQIQVRLRVHDYPNLSIPWYYFRFMPYVEVVAIRVKLGDAISNSYIQEYNNVKGAIREGMELPFDSTFAFLNLTNYGDPEYFKTPKSSLTSPPAKVDYTDPRDGTNYNDTPAVMEIIPYGDWKATNKNGSWGIAPGTTTGGLYIAVYKGTCICYDLEIVNIYGQRDGWFKRYQKYTGDIRDGLLCNYIGPNGKETISYK